MFAAVEDGDVKMIEQFLAQHPKKPFLPKIFRATDYRKRTVLHVAVEHGDHEIVDALTRKRGIKLDAKDCGGFTVLHLAVESGYDKIVARLFLRRVRC